MLYSPHTCISSFLPPSLPPTLTASTQFTQKMRLLTEPLREMARTRQNQTLTSKPIKWQQFRSLLLHIDPVGPHDGMAATLYLEDRATANSLPTAELTLTHPRKRPSRNSKSRNGSHGGGMPSLTLFQSTVVMDMPDKATPPGLSSVAKFPMILSHRHLLNRKLVKAPFVEISLTLRQQ